MFVITTPPADRILRLQRVEQACYFSACAEMLLRKHGVISVCGETRDGVGGGFPIVTRLAEPDREVITRPGCCECPTTSNVAEMLAITAEAGEARRIEIADEHERALGAAAYPSITVREIPSGSAMASESHPFVSDDPAWNNRRIRYCRMKASEPWRVIAHMRVDGGPETIPAAVSDGVRLVLALPLFDLIVASHAFAPLDTAYYAHDNRGCAHYLEQWLIRQLLDHAVAAGVLTVRAPNWPETYTSALTIRHDYDRRVEPHDLDALLDFYDSIGVKSSWGFLANRPDVQAMREVAGRGHEITLHSEAHDEETFTEELRCLEEWTGIRPAGYTTHGGRGSSGFLGQKQHEWAVSRSLRYGELLGRDNRLPHPAVALGSDRPPAVLPLVLPACHWSLDSGTGPEAHNLDRLAEVIPEMLRDGAHVVVMNHPDIHRSQLGRLLGDLNLSAVWCATFREVAEWVGAVKFHSRVEPTDTGLRVEFGSPLPLGTRLVSRTGPAKLRESACTAGATSVHADLR